MAKPRRNIPEAAGVEIAQALKAGGKASRNILAKYTRSPWHWSEDKVYAVAKDFGWTSGRKPRTDKGNTRIKGLTKTHIELFAKILFETTRFKTGKRLASSEDIRQQMILNGHKVFENVSVSTINRLLKHYKLDHKQL